MSSGRDVIYALATAPGRAGLAVIRVSGENALAVCAPMLESPVAFRRPSVRKIRDHRTGELVDEALVIAFPEGASFTGEETVELHCHGSRAVVQGVLSALETLDAARSAKAGEFTRRALENGRLDLVQVEGLADLIDAESAEQRRQALRVMGGELSRKVANWRSKLVEASALLEANIDFSDEEIPEESLNEAFKIIEDVSNDFAKEVEGSFFAERLRDGFNVVVVGKPNIGKSTLINHIAGREVAITSEIPGTTRDILEVSLDLGGIPVTLMDTAGLRETTDPLEAIGVRNTRSRIGEADLRIFLLEDCTGSCLPEGFVEGDIVVGGKADLFEGQGSHGVSGLTGEGVGDLLRGVESELAHRVASARSVVRGRQREAIARANGNLRQALRLLELDGSALELVSEELRLSLQALDELIGRVDVEGLLDVIFSSFCIGK